MFEVQATMNFRDMVENKMRHRGDVWTVHTMERVQELLSAGPGKKGVINIISAKKRQSNKYEGPKIIISQSHLYYIGGIETFVINFTKHYKDRNITLLSSIMDNKTILVMSEYCDVIKDELNNYECDVLLLGNYDCEGVLPRIKSKKVYQMIHGDLRGLKKYLPGGERGFKWQKHPRVDKIISVSQSAADGLMEVSKYDSEVIYNILDDEPLDDMKVFITLSRATAEKGIGRMIKMAEAFRKAGKHFVWYICCSLEQAPREYVYKIKSIPEFVIVPPGQHNKALISHCDYLVQLSDTESFCYSAFEALQRKVPVILTRFPEAYNIVEHGKNGYLVDMELADLDVDAIFNRKPKKVTFIDRCDYDKWEQFFTGEL